MDIRCSGIDWGYTRDGNLRLSLDVAPTSAEAVKAQYDGLTGKLLDVRIVRHTKKRSLDANALMWKCIGGLRDCLNAGRDGLALSSMDVYLDMLEKYGWFVFLVVPPGAVAYTKRLFRICREMGEIPVGRQRGVQLQCWPGSSKYDVPQMTALLNGVIAECRDWGAWVPDEQDVGYSLDIWRREVDDAKHPTGG